MIILGIETSCDETALALIETRKSKDIGDPHTTEYRVIQSLVHSQAELHSAYGGVFPTLAKREHSKNLAPLLDKILKDMPNEHKVPNDNLKTLIEQLKKEYGEQNSELLESVAHARFLNIIPNIDKIAVTEGPGLEPALWVGITFAKILGKLWNIPVIPVNHMEGHVVGSLISDDKPYGAWQRLKELPLPAVALLVSGGHTELIKIEDSKLKIENKYKGKKAGFEYSLLGQTVDDAVGEAFDKTARLLGLPYPGGPHLSKMAQEARDEHIGSVVSLPRPMIKSGDLNFSFSGLKTAVLYAVRDAQKSGLIHEDPKKDTSPESQAFKKGLASEFEQSILDIFDVKVRKAIENTSSQSLIVGGGVSANRPLREKLKNIADLYQIPLLLPSMHISGDNALMIALVGAISETKNSNSIDIHAQGTKKLAE